MEHIEREAMEFDVVIVGAGPAGLSAAIKIRQLAIENNLPDLSVCVVEKGSEVYHSFYGNRPYYDGPFEWVLLVFLGCLIWTLAPRIAPKLLRK